VPETPFRLSSMSNLPQIADDRQINNFWRNKVPHPLAVGFSYFASEARFLDTRLRGYDMRIFPESSGPSTR